MAYTTINKSADYFNTKLYTGDGSSSKSITGVGFQPDLVWVKSRVATHNHFLWDVVRGVQKRISSNGNGAEGTDTNGLASFDSDGFTLGNKGSINSNTDNYASWNWKAGSSNTSVSASGSGNGAYNACTYRANTTAGFSIVQYTGRNGDINNGDSSRVTHGLGVKPDFIIIKRTDSSENWAVIRGNSNDNHLVLNDTGAASGSFYTGNQNADATSTYFVVGNSGRVNQEGGTFIAYVFAEKTGYSKFGTYTGNGNADGTFVYTGFKPAWVLMKKSDGVEDWAMFDSTRDTHNVQYKLLYANGTNAEYTGVTARNDFLSNGFKIRTTDNKENASGGTYIYMAFGQSLVGSNNVPCTAR